MADFRRGIIAGVAAAIVFVIISVILNVTGLADRYTFFEDLASLFFWFDLSEPWLMILQLPTRLIEGVIFGAIFASLCAFLPGRTAVRKAIVVSLIIWAIGVMQSRYTSLRLAWLVDGVFPHTAFCWQMVDSYILGSVLISIASAVAFGALAGAIWNRLKAREVREPRPGSAALLAGFAVGIWMWLGAAIHVIGAVATGWFWEFLPDFPAFRWVIILYAFSAVVGLAGWILVLLGWRRTKRGKNGFRRGLAGGILMAVTGVMLLPGVVSIIGAVLSRREPASKPAMSTQL